MLYICHIDEVVDLWLTDKSVNAEDQRTDWLGILLLVSDAAVQKLLWVDKDNSHVLTYYCGHVMNNGQCNGSSLYINLLRRDGINTAISSTSLDSMSVALRTVCLEPGDLQISDQSGVSDFV